MKKILSLISIMFLLFAPIKISHATMIPSGSVTIPAQTVWLRDSGVTLFSMTTPEDNPIVGITASFEIENLYVNNLYIYLDGQIIWSNDDETTYTPSCSLTGLNGNNIRISAYAYDGGWDVAIKGGTVQTAVEIADEEARDAAIAAKNEAINAKNAANTAAARSYYNGNTSAYWSYYGYARANSASSRVWDSAEGKSAATLSKEARDKANAAAGDADYIRNTQLPDIENKIASLQSDVTNIKTNLSAGDTTPPDIKSIEGYRNATCTTDSIFKLVIEASDNSSGVEFRAKADTGSWTGWITSNPITVSEITGTGAHTIEVEVRDAAGNVARDSITIFKI